MKKTTQYLLVFCFFSSLSLPVKAGVFTNLFNSFMATTPIQPKPKPKPPQPEQLTMTRRQAQEYVDQFIVRMERVLNEQTTHHTRRTLRNRILDSIWYNDYVYVMTNYGKQYKKDAIDQVINSAILEFIEERSFHYAHKYSHNQTIARKVSESMRNNALAIIQKSTTLDVAVVLQFVGKPLKKAVREAVNRFDAPYDPAPPIHNSHHSAPKPPQPTAPTHHAQQTPTQAEQYYPSSDCCICFESFDDVKRVFLKPCGHDMCTDCARSWFFENNQQKNKGCPQCRNTVCLNSLSIDIATAA